LDDVENGKNKKKGFFYDIGFGKDSFAVSSSSVFFFRLRHASSRTNSRISAKRTIANAPIVNKLELYRAW
jgi:hypothetical protein